MQNVKSIETKLLELDMAQLAVYFRDVGSSLKSKYLAHEFISCERGVEHHEVMMLLT